MASLVAGSRTESFIGAASDAELIVVKLRKARPYYLEKFMVPLNQQNAFESSDVMVGVEYIIKKAAAAKKPAVICLGLGTNFGGHNGFSVFKQYLTEISQFTGVCVCVAAGNESSTKHHFSGKLLYNKDMQTVDVMVGRNVSDLYLTMWNNLSDRLSVSVRSPSGDIIGPIQARLNARFDASFVFEKTGLTVKYPNYQWGYGRLNLQQSFELLKGIF